MKTKKKKRIISIVEIHEYSFETISLKKVQKIGNRLKVEFILSNGFIEGTIKLSNKVIKLSKANPDETSVSKSVFNIDKQNLFYNVSYIPIRSGAETVNIFFSILKMTRDASPFY